MKQVKLQVKIRKETGNNTAKRCRKVGGIPAVIYGESGTKSLTVDKIDFSKIEKSVIGKAVLLDLEYDDGSESQFAVIKKIDRNPVTDVPLHIDFLEVVRGKPMNAVVPFRVFGESVGVKNEGGVIEVHHHEVKVVCRPRDLPEEIVFDITALKVGEIATIKDLPKVEGVEYHESADRIMVTCSLTKSATAESNETKAAAENEAAKAAEAAKK